MLKKKHIKTSRNAWFVPVRWSYLPASPAGWALYIPYTAYLLATLLWTYRHNPTLPGFLLELIPLWVAGVVIMQWIASHKS